MATINVKIDSHIKEYTEELEQKVHAWLEAIGLDAASTVQGIISGIPLVDTGRMKNSIYPIVVDDHSVQVGSNVSYTKYHELGTRSLPAYHFIEKGCQMHSEQYKSMLEEMLKE